MKGLLEELNKKQLKDLIKLTKNDFKKDYINRYQKIKVSLSDPTQLPLKKEYTEEQNQRFDLNRIRIIKDILALMMDYSCHTGVLSFHSPRIVNKYMADYFDRVVVFNNMELLKMISSTIMNMSSDIRYKYKGLLGPHPFRWETLDQLAGSMVRPYPDSEVTLCYTPDTCSEELANTFHKECCNRIPVAEAAIPDIVKYDIPQLAALFDYIHSCETQQTVPPIMPLKLVAIKALTRRLYDTKNLQALLFISSNAYNTCNIYNYQRLGIPLTQSYEKDGQKCYRDYIMPSFEMLSTKLEQHAALRRIQRIGELLTGKNFSSHLTTLDDTIDWESIITIRDGITHQDEGNNREIIKDLLTNRRLRLVKIINKDLPELYILLSDLLQVRSQKLPAYIDDPELFWEKLYEHEKQSKTDSASTVSSAIRRVTIEEEATFLAALVNKSSDEKKAAWKGVIDDPTKLPSLDDVKAAWKGIFDGSSELPGRNHLGRLFSYVVFKQVNKDLNKICADIRDKALNANKLSATGREQKRQAEQDAARQRETELDNKYTSLKNIRKLAKRFKAPVNSYMSRVQRLDAAIEALENIKVFLEQDPNINANFNYPSIAEWKRSQPKYAAEIFYMTLLNNPQLNDAIEYNGGQLLLHLDKIREYEEAKSCFYLNQGYPLLRILRNYIEHGYYLLEHNEYNPHKQQEPIPRRLKTIAPNMIGLIFKLLPDLKAIRQRLVDNINYDEKAMHGSPLCSEEELRQWKTSVFKKAG